MSAKLYGWLTNPENEVVPSYDSSKEKYVVEWHTDHGRISACAETLDGAIRKAYEIAKNPNPEERRRLAYMPTANTSNTAWSTGNRNGKWGWYGYVKIQTELDAEEIDFTPPKLPKGWKFNEFGSSIRRAKCNKRMAYLDQCGHSQWRFGFEVVADTKEIWMDGDRAIFNALCESVGEVERAHFIIE